MRRIEPLPMMKEELPELDLGKTPELRWVDPCSLMVDDNYQRTMESRRSFNLILKMIREFAWAKMKPPIVVEVGSELHCINGQHTATAAATRQIPLIPVFVVGADQLAERAGAFVAHNRDQVTLDPISVYRAEVKAGDGVAVMVDRLCRETGVTIRHISPTTGKLKTGDTVAVATLRSLVVRRGVETARRVLLSFTLAEHAPISSAEIVAVEAVLFANKSVSVEQMASVIRAMGTRGVAMAVVTAKSDRKPIKHALYADYVRMLRKQGALSTAA